MTRSELFVKYSHASRELYEDFIPDEMIKEAEELWEEYSEDVDPSEHAYRWNKIAHEMEKQAISIKAIANPRAAGGTNSPVLRALGVKPGGGTPVTGGVSKAPQLKPAYKPDPRYTNRPQPKFPG